MQGGFLRLLAWEMTHHLVDFLSVHFCLQNEPWTKPPSQPAKTPKPRAPSIPKIQKDISHNVVMLALLVC